MNIARAAGGYLVVTLKGVVDYDTVHRLLIREIARPDFLHSNDIWHFVGCLPDLHFDELDAIVQDIARVYPDGATRKRTALVVEPGLMGAMVNLWVEHARELPFEVKVFEVYDEAVDWVTS
ncbi:MAG: hypothetical protein R3D98_10945 [Candidatus Krumholzibacteriia bacterium]